MQKKTFVFDSSTLILLAKATLLRSFTERNRVIITKVVEIESLAKKDSDDAKIISNLINTKLILKSTKKNSSTKFKIDFEMGEGETEALNLAFNEKFILATDDLRAIKACKILDVKFVTAIHCLIYLFKKGRLDLRLALEKLNSLERYGRYREEIIKDARSIIQNLTRGEQNG